jgi:hypothetical protein
VKASSRVEASQAAKAKKEEGNECKAEFHRDVFLVLIENDKEMLPYLPISVN